ncbi:MAG: hypothetical protein HY814_08320 [Candidatus Riflebacteria bacterium]|nr:hypothetical protein [Candidatus Riflebacteria bacterium]
MEKRLLVPDRVRRPPASGWSWVDREFLREHAGELGRDAILLYLFLAAVSDRNGLSFYRDVSIAIRLRLSEQAVVAARQELIAHDLVAHHAPLTQVLSLPKRKLPCGGRDAEVIGDLLRQFAARQP